MNLCGGYQFLKQYYTFTASPPPSTAWECAFNSSIDKVLGDDTEMGRGISFFYFKGGYFVLCDSGALVK